MQIIKHKSCNNVVKLLIIPTYLITNSKVITNYSVRARHHTVLPFWIRRLLCRQFHRWIGHVIIRSWRFESLGDSVGKKYPQ